MLPMLQNCALDFFGRGFPHGILDPSGMRDSLSQLHQIPNQSRDKEHGENKRQRPFMVHSYFVAGATNVF